MILGVKKDLRFGPQTFWAKSRFVSFGQNGYFRKNAFLGVKKHDFGHATFKPSFSKSGISQKGPFLTKVPKVDFRCFFWSEIWENGHFWRSLFDPQKGALVGGPPR